MAQGMLFVKRLLAAFLTGFAIGVGTNLFIFPVSSRTVVFKEMVGYVAALTASLKAQVAYLQSLEEIETISASPPAERTQKSKQEPDTEHPAAKKMKTTVRALGELHGKLHADILFAKREVAYGKLDARDIDDLFKKFRKILLPVLGLTSLVDIFERVITRRGWKESDQNDAKRQEKEEFNEVMKTLHDPFESLVESMVMALHHSLYVLELVPRPKERKGDLEAKAETVNPGEDGFAAYYGSKIETFHEQRRITLDLWCKNKGIDWIKPEHDQDQIDWRSDTRLQKTSSERHQMQSELYILLYMEFLMNSAADAVMDLVRYADSMAENGRMTKRRLIYPSGGRLRKWFMGMFHSEDASNTNYDNPDSAEAGSYVIDIGDSLQAAKDPEHLPPKNAWERFGNQVRGLSHALGSSQSAFGFRVACATMSIAIIAFLRQSQVFFTTQRVVWALIMVAIGMTVTAGSGVFGLLGRVFGTFIAMCASLVIWYVAGGTGVTGAVLPLLYIWLVFIFYFLVKYPRFIVVCLLSMVTTILILGYEMEVKVIGVKLATSTGQPAYHTYLLAPYRLATVAAGCFVAFIWTFFPYPLTARAALRRDLGSSIFLLANFYSCVHTTIGLRLQGQENIDVEDSPARKLEKARNQVFAKQLALLGGLRTHLSFTDWEPTCGGKFPKENYEAIVQEVQNILNYIALISFATGGYAEMGTTKMESQTWLRDLGKVVSSVDVTSQEITSMLSLLSGSLTNGTPLPPYLRPPTPYQLSEHLEAIDKNILSVDHILEPGFAAFAVTQVAATLITDDLEKLVRSVQGLVGVVDFSFHIISTSTGNSDESREKGKHD
ncbi:hypothetical protein MMC09_004129 [Bachmanniomyces sp. S44760]|nr:hypothetical protein [Bachmanniomyces sp. S44760]